MNVWQGANAISNKRWNKLPEVLEIRIGFNIATEMVAGFFWTNHRTEKGKNQCNFGPLYTPFVKLSTPFYREEYHPRKHHFCLFKQKTWRVNQEAMEPFLGRKKIKPRVNNTFFVLYTVFAPAKDSDRTFQDKRCFCVENPTCIRPKIWRSPLRPFFISVTLRSNKFSLFQETEKRDNMGCTSFVSALQLMVGWVSIMCFFLSSSALFIK